MAGAIRFWRSAAAASVLLVWLAGVAWSEPEGRSAGPGLRAARPASSRPATATGVASRPAAGEPVVFTTEDNLVIAGSFYGPQRPGEPAPMAILLHMVGTSRSDFDPLVPHLTKEGFAVLAIDLRGHGQSTGPPAMGLAGRVAQRDRTLFAQMVRDVEGACRWLGARPGVDPSRFVLVGASVGGSVATAYAAKDRSVDAVVWLTPGVEYLGIDAIGPVHDCGDRPLLLLASEAERADAEQLGRIARKATVRLYPVPPDAQDADALHGPGLLGRVPGIETYISGFLSRSVGPFSQERVVASVKGKVYYDPDSNQARRLSPGNVRWFSSPSEAEARGLAPPAASRLRKSEPDAHAAPARQDRARSPKGR